MHFWLHNVFKIFGYKCYKYLEKCFENRTRGGLVIRDTNPDIAETYKVDIAQVKSIPEITFGSNDAVDIVIECCTEVETQR